MGVLNLARKQRIIYFLFYFLVVTSLAQTESSGDLHLRQAINTFAQGQYDEALRLFRNIILDSAQADLHGDSYFWIAKSYMALGQYESASKNLEFFLSEYSHHKYYPEGLYQRGRLVFLQGGYEAAVQALEDFANRYPESPFVANSYFWIGESLYALGHFGDALDIFKIVVDRFPTSFKIEAARYRVSLIELKERERELLKLLKWSHEEYLKALEEFDLKERSYEQAILSYQRRIREYESGDEEDPQVKSLQDTVKELQAQIENYKELLAASPDITESVSAPSGTQELLDLKQQALELKSYYLLWLSALQ